jgi:hypothetical protein
MAAELSVSTNSTYRQNSILTQVFHHVVSNSSPSTFGLALLVALYWDLTYVLPPRLTGLNRTFFSHLSDSPGTLRTMKLSLISASLLRSVCSLDRYRRTHCIASTLPLPKPMEILFVGTFRISGYSSPMFSLDSLRKIAVTTCETFSNSQWILGT